MGIPVSFSGQVDFSGITGDSELNISDVLHKAYVSVNEEGTEAAAATAVGLMQTTIYKETIKVVTVDHPFIFLIRDIETGTLLFIGQVMNPNP